MTLPAPSSLLAAVAGSRHLIWCHCASSQFEGLPTYPDVSRMWEIVDKYRVTKFYTAPTAIRMLMKFGDEPVRR